MAGGRELDIDAGITLREILTSGKESDTSCLMVCCYDYQSTLMCVSIVKT